MYKAVMAKVGLDAICAKLCRNAEITSREVNSCSPQRHPYNDDYSGDDAIHSDAAAVDKVDHQYRAVASGSASALPLVTASVDVVERENVMTFFVDELGTSRAAVDRTKSLMDSGFGDEAAFDGDEVDDGCIGSTGRSSRRKNFLPRYVQDGMVVVERASEPYQAADAATTSTTKWSTAVENVEDSQTVLDLRTGRSSSPPTRRAGDLPAKFGDGAQDQILDLSVSRCGRGPLGDGAQRGANESRMTDRSSAAGEQNAATDMRVYAMNTMSELLHIYGLPDDQQSAVTDLRKWVSPENNSGTGTQTCTGVGVRPVQCDVARSAGMIQDRERVTARSLSTSHVPDVVVEQKQQHAYGLSHVKGS